MDNHLINNPIFSVVGADGKTPLPKAIWDEVMAIRKSVLRSIRAFSPPHYSFAFTNMILEGDVVGLRGYRQIVRLARARKARYVPVRILCDAQAMRQRKDTPDRRARFKEIDLSNIEWLLKHREVLKITHPNLLTLDVSDLTARQSATAILNHVRNYADSKPGKPA